MLVDCIRKRWKKLPARTFLEVKGQEVPVKSRIKLKFSKIY